MLIRITSIFLLALYCAGCAPTVAPPGPGAPVGAVAPRLDAHAFITADHLSLPVRAWLPDGQPTAVIAALHGFNDYSKAFDTVPDAPGTGPFLAARGIAVYAYDQRGFGESADAGYWHGADRMAADLADFVTLLRGRYPAVPIYSLGESMGGAVVMTALTGPDPPAIDGAVLVAPAVWARATMPWPYRVALWLGARLTPGLKPTGRGLGIQASDNIEMLRANARDPLFIKETRIDAIFGLVNLMDDALASAAKIDLPVLYLYGGNDQVIPKDATRKATAGLEADPGFTWAYYPKHWHMMLRDKHPEDALGDIAAYVTDPAAPLPSGADRADRAVLARNPVKRP